MLNQQKKTLVIFICFFIFGCKQSNKDANGFNKVKIDSLLLKANDTKTEKLKRIEYADLVLELLKNNKNDSITRDHYSNLSGVYYYLKQDKKFVSVCKTIILKSESAKDFILSGTTNYNLGGFYHGKSNIDSAYYYYNKAEKTAISLKDKNNLDYVLISKANLLWSQKDCSGAEVMAIKALKIAVKRKDELSIYVCYITLGNILIELNNSNKALEYYNKALKKADSLKKNAQYKSFKAQAFNYISKVYQKSNDFKKAIYFSNQGLKFEDLKKEDIALHTYLTNNLAYSKFKLGDKLSVKKFQETLKIGDSINSIPIQIISKMYLGEFYLLEKDTLKANYYFTDALKQAENVIFNEERLKILKFLSQANPAKEAFYSKRYIHLNDSLQNVERATRDKFARIEFETNEITQEKKVVETKNNNLINRIWVLSGFALMSILLLFLWFKNKSQKAKTRELLLKQEQQKANEEIYQLMLNQQQNIQEGKNIEKQRISLELHDGVMGKLTSVRLNLYANLYKEGLIDKEVFSTQINEIQLVEQEIRNIAHNLNSNMFSNNVNFSEIVNELFAKIKNHSTIKFELEVSNTVNWDLVKNEIKINLFRIIQEALQNIEKYANASAVFISISQYENELSIEIIDNGIGFDITQIKDGIGIKNMKTRTEEMKGKFIIQSKVGNNTKINLTIPI